MVPRVAFSLAHDVHIGDYLVRIRCAGTGRPLLLLHDIGGCGASFAHLTSAIVAAGREAVAPDLPGFAQSDPIPGDIVDLIDYLQVLADQTIEGPIDVIGRGFGAFLALSLASQQPERYQRLVLEDPMLPPSAGGRASSRMGAGRALNGAFTAVRRGRILQNVGGFARAKSLLEALARPDQAWWDGLAQISADCLLVDLGGGRPEDRARLSALESAIKRLTVVDLSTGRNHQDAGSAAERAVLDFVG